MRRDTTGARSAGPRIAPAASGNARASTPCSVAASPPSGTPAGASRSARSTASATGTSRSPTRRWHVPTGQPGTTATLPSTCRPRARPRSRSAMRRTASSSRQTSRRSPDRRAASSSVPRYGAQGTTAGLEPSHRRRCRSPRRIRVPDLKLGILLWSQAGTWPELLDGAKRVDALGYEHLWTWDHVYAIFGDPYQPIFEGYTTLAAWAMATQRARLGLMVGANTFRNPELVAKMIATIDHISNGRAIAGLGGAWFDHEHQADGIDFGSSVGQRLDWLDESARAIRALLDGEVVTSEPGGHYAFDEAVHHPAPVQRHVPIMIG